MSESHSSNNKEVPEIYDAGYDGLHLDNLYDQDETVAGDLIDPATGLPYDNSTETDSQLFHEGERQVGYVFEPDETESASESGLQVDSLDPEEAKQRKLEAAADALLAEHDGVTPLEPLPDSSFDDEQDPTADPRSRETIAN